MRKPFDWKLPETMVCQLLNIKLEACMKKMHLIAAIVLSGLLLAACANPALTSSSTISVRSISAGFNGDVTIKAVANGKFVCADNSGTSPLVANRDTASGWETFTLVAKGGNDYAIKAQANGLFVCADNWGWDPLIANRTTAGDWETFTLVPLGGDNFAIKAKVNGKFVCADNAGVTALTANRDTASGWETFTIVATANPTPSPTPTPSPGEYPAGSPVALHGWLHLNGTQLVDQNNNVTVLRGMSSHGLQWFGQFVNLSSLTTLRDDWHADIIRCAMYTAEGGYLSNPAVKDKVIETIENAGKLGIYVLVDWHILSDNDPMMHVNEAKAFFQEISAKYGNKAHVIYEICNEPNSGATYWGSIKPYAQIIIPAIRANSPNSIAIVGTGTWSQDVQDPASDPLPYANTMYTLHFYAGSHGQWLIDRAKAAVSKIALFVTEWGTSGADGAGSVDYGQSDMWMNFLDSYHISWCNWSLCDKTEATAALNPGANVNGGWGTSQLTASGNYVRDHMRAPR